MKMTAGCTPIACGTLVVLLAVTLQGCGGGGGSVTTTATTTTTPKTPSPPEPAVCPDTFKRGHCSSCLKDNGGSYSCSACSAPYALQQNPATPDLWCTFSCDGFKAAAKPGLPALAQGNNGVEWPSVCIEESSSHFLTIGDWGGMCGWGKDNVCTDDVKASFCSTKYGDALPGKPCPMPDNRGSAAEIDYRAQSLVSERMQQRAEDLKKAGTPAHFIVNVGDNFYPGGIDLHCGKGNGADVANNLAQFTKMWKDMYQGELANLEWWSILGNHDYGGTCYLKGWDQQIFYTWHDPSNTWILPGQYWRRQVQYQTFKVDFFFIDGNFVDSSLDPQHSICASRANPFLHCEEAIYPGSGASCSAAGGPTSVDDCHDWFHKLWANQYKWLTEGLGNSTADWQILVNHYPPSWDVGYGKMMIRWKNWLEDNGVDLYISGHTHEQKVYLGDHGHSKNMGKTAWVITGGGGGVQSAIMPIPSGFDDSYGFMDMEISLNTIVMTAYTHGGTGKRMIPKNTTTQIPVPRKPVVAKRPNIELV